jgi:hypothetical protein
MAAMPLENPKATLAVQCGNGFGAGFRLYIEVTI